MNDIVVALLVLMVLIFVHELGHFIAAKACGVYVDRFSIGMPPRLFGFKWGETDYCIGLIPIGGYVKMAGQEDAPRAEEEKERDYGNVPPERWFSNKPRWQRAVVLFAGPAMNFVLAFVIFAVIGAIGKEVPLSEIDNRVGVVEPDSPASKAPLFLAMKNGDFSDPPDAVGWQTGDRLLRINGNLVTGIEDVFMAGVLGVGKTAQIEIERVDSDGRTLRYLSPVEPKIIDESGLTRFGMVAFDTALISHVLQDSPAEIHGLQSDDIIVTANGSYVDTGSFSLMVRGLSEGETLDLEFERDGEMNSVTLTPESENRFDGRFAFIPPLRPLLQVGESSPPTIGFDDADFTRETGLNVGDVILSIGGEPATGRLLREMSQSYSDETLEVVVERPAGGFPFAKEGGEHTLAMPFEKIIQGLTGFDEQANPVIAIIGAEVSEATGLQRKDIITEIDGQPATIALLRETERTRPGEVIPVKIHRPAIWKGLLQKEEFLESELTVSTAQLIGVVWKQKMEFQRAAPAEILPQAADRCYRVVTQIGKLLGVLIKGDVSPKKALGGPVMIYQITTHYARTGILRLLDFMAVISINLCILNLLPLPVLDGGQLMFLGIEAIRRKPVSVRVFETVQQLGLLFLIGFFLYITFNDISRLVTGLIP